MKIKYREFILKSFDLPAVGRDSQDHSNLVRDFEFEAGLVASRQRRSLAVNLSLSVCLFIGMLLQKQVTFSGLLFLVLISAISLIRARKLTVQSLKEGQYSAKSWYTLFAKLTLSLGFLWGGLTTSVLIFYGADNKIGFFLILLMAGLSAGALASMTPWKKISIFYVSCLLGIPITALVIMDPARNFAFSLATFVFYAFIIAQAQQIAEMFVSLRDREVRFQTMNRSGMEGGLIHRNGVILEVNDAFLHIFNMEREEVLKKPLLDFIRPDYHLLAREKLKEANNFWETICVRPDGSEIMIEAWASAIEFGGSPARVVHVRDIAARKKIEDALRESEHNLKEFMTSAFDSLSHILLVISKDGKFESVNQKWRDFSGMDVDDTNVSNFVQIVAPEDRDGFLKFIRSRPNTEQEFSAQLMRKLDGSYRWHLGRSSPAKDRNGVITKWFITWTDTHDQIQGIKRNHELEVTAKSAREASQIKSSFLANMSHEIRTPLNAIIGLSDLLLELPATPLQNKYQSTLKKSAESLFDIVNDILDLSKIEAGHVVAEEVDFDLATLVEFQVELMASRARDKSLSLSSYIDPSIPASLKGDSTRVAQVILNLLSNAVKFTKVGGVAVKAALLHESEEQAYVRFEVEDSGIGMSSDEQKKLFQPFSQVDTSHTRKYGGTGLGLSICLGLIQVMGGRVFVHSESGQGSLFVVDLPFRLDRKKLAELRDAGVASSSAILAAHDSMGPALPNALPLMRRVLLLDSEPLAFGAKHSYLKYWNFDGAHLTLGELFAKGLKLLENSELLVLDTSLPPAEFERALRWVKEAPPRLQAKILLVGDESVRQELVGLDLDESVRFLAKPIKQKEFKELLDGKRPATSRIRRSSEKPEPDAVTRSGEARVSSKLALLSETDASFAPSSLSTAGSADACANGGIQHTAVHLPKPVSSKQILVVEDNTTNQMLIKALLKMLGYEPHVVANGLEAIEALKAKSFDLILMDCQMPEMDGFEATLRIRATEIEEKKLEKIRIIALTANVRVEDRARCFAVGMDDFLSKPVRREALVEKLDQWLAA